MSICLKKLREEPDNPLPFSGQIGHSAAYIIGLLNLALCKVLRSGTFDYRLKPADFDELSAKIGAARRQKDEHDERLRAAEARALMRPVPGSGWLLFGGIGSLVLCVFIWAQFPLS